MYFHKIFYAYHEVASRAHSLTPLFKKVMLQSGNAGYDQEYTYYHFSQILVCFEKIILFTFCSESGELESWWSACIAPCYERAYRRIQKLPERLIIGGEFNAQLYVYIFARK